MTVVGVSVVAYFPDDSFVIAVLAKEKPVDPDRVEAAITAAWYRAHWPASSHRKNA